jgi:hypothetical protein
MQCTPASRSPICHPKAGNSLLIVAIRPAAGGYGASGS